MTKSSRKKQKKTRKMTNRKSLWNLKKKIRGGKKESSTVTGTSSFNSAGGIYCYMPYDALDKKNKSTFKIDSSMNIKKSYMDLKTFYPDGFFIIASLQTPTKLISKFKKKIDYYHSIKEEMLEYIQRHDGIIDPQHEKGWIYCLEKTIHNAFNMSQMLHEGDLKEFALSGRRADNFELIKIENETNPKFVGNVVFHT